MLLYCLLLAQADDILFYTNLRQSLRSNRSHHHTVYIGVVPKFIISIWCSVIFNDLEIAEICASL